MHSSLDQATIRLSNGSQFNHDIVSSQIAGIESTSAVGFQRMLSHMNDDLHLRNSNSQKLDLISQKQSRVLSAVEAFTGGLSSRPSQIRGGFQQIKDGHILDLTPSAARKAFNGSSRDDDASEFIELWRSNSHYLLFGRLYVLLHGSRKARHMTQEVVREEMHLEISVNFVASKWLSKLAISFMAKIYCDCISREWKLGANLKPIVYNSDPSFIAAVRARDVEGLRKVFRMGMARPTDYIVDFANAVPWYQVSQYL